MMRRSAELAVRRQENPKVGGGYLVFEKGGAGANCLSRVCANARLFVLALG
ncbi:hypothetical protein DVH05_020250 [Phytophthora capsici]|nr:hypothetical protein DVH05_020250 [Phytophthora capsici]